MYDFKIKGGKHENDLNHRDQLIRDMIYIGCLPYVSKKTFHEVLDKAVCWPLSDKGKTDIQRTAKYRGCTYWSEEAYKEHLEPYIFESSKSLKIKGFKESSLKHEHVVPRCIFIRSMERYFKTLRAELENKTNEEVSDILNDRFKYLKEHIDKKIFGCVITENEDKTMFGKELKDKMPDDHLNFPDKPLDFFDIQDPWARYKKAGFKEVYKVDWELHKNKDGSTGRGWEPKGKGILVDIHSLK